VLGSRFASSVDSDDRSGDETSRLHLDEAEPAGGKPGDDKEMDKLGDFSAEGLEISPAIRIRLRSSPH
jgi:hypothetical protein